MRAKRTTPTSSPAELAVLGLLAISHDSRHGYDLSREFQPGGALGDVIRIAPGMLYHHLKRLEEKGWTAATVEPIANRPPRQSYTLTPTGEAALDRWLAEPVAHTREVRLEFLVKLYLAQRREPALAARLVAEQRTRLAELLRTIEEQASHLEDGSFARSVLDLRAAQTRAALEWLETL